MGTQSCYFMNELKRNNMKQCKILINKASLEESRKHIKSARTVTGLSAGFRADYAELEKALDLPAEKINGVNTVVINPEGDRNGRVQELLIGMDVKYKTVDL